MRTTLSYFTGSLLFSAVVLAAAGWYGFQLGGPAMAGSFLVTALVLAILETSVSFDNAVVNASVLQAMSSLWRKLFHDGGRRRRGVRHAHTIPAAHRRRRRRHALA
ncbi:DUF475 domain-containing protein [Chromobacterium haemolyticum]|nr:DUF475 domain-containing protein [Chromobacterium haemolyticum]